MSQLSPYDTGARLEPRPWPTDGDPDRFGRVDFDNDESATELVVYVEATPDPETGLPSQRGSAGYDVHIELLAGEETTRVLVDGVLYGPITEDGPVEHYNGDRW